MATNTVGIDCTWNAALICGSASTSIFAKTNLPLYSRANCSKTGESCLQGPHQVAHRSITTGTFADCLMTSCSKSAVVTSMINFSEIGFDSLVACTWAAFASASRAAATAPKSIAPCKFIEFCDTGELQFSNRSDYGTRIIKASP